MRVGATIARPSSGAELIDNIKVRAEPPARALRGKPHEVRLELEFGRAVGVERQEDRFDGEVQPGDACWKAERED